MAEAERPSNEGAPRRPGRGRQLQSASAMLSFLDTALIPIAMLDRRLRLIRQNERWSAAVGFSAGDSIGRPIRDLLPGSVGLYPGLFKRALAGETVRLDRTHIEMPDGRSAWFEATVGPWRTARGKVGGLVIMAYDVTEMTEALESAEQSNRRLKLAVDIADLTIVETDYQKRSFSIEGCSNLIDRPITFEMIEQGFSLVHEEDRAAIREKWRAADEAVRFRAEYRVNRRDGREVWAATAAELTRAPDGAPMRMVGVLRNISEEKQRERELVRARDAAEAASRAKSAFLATVSHELRTPLNGVLGIAQAMAGDELSPAQRARLDVLQTSARALAGVLGSLVDLANIAADKLQLKPAEFSLEGLLDDLEALFAPLAEGKGLGLSLDCEPDARGACVGDEPRLRQILQELLTNALKFTDQGGVRLVVSRSGDTLTFCVEDTGVGVTADELPHLFDNFFQVEDFSTRRVGGLGLGLPICRALVDQMGGEIELAPRRQGGLRVRVSAPFPPVARAPTQLTSEAPAPELDGLRVLLAEDNPVNQVVVQALVAPLGINPMMVSDGRQAVEAWATGAWDLILMDIQMPVMDGLSAARAIRRREAELGRPRTPIIAVTANVLGSQLAEYASAGIDAVVAKPVDALRLFTEIHRLASSETQPAPRAAIG